MVPLPALVEARQRRGPLRHVEVRQDGQGGRLVGQVAALREVRRGPGDVLRACPGWSGSRARRCAAHAGRPARAPANRGRGSPCAGRSRAKAACSRVPMALRSALRAWWIASGSTSLADDARQVGLARQHQELRPIAGLQAVVGERHRQRVDEPLGLRRPLLAAPCGDGLQSARARHSPAPPASG